MSPKRAERAPEDVNGVPLVDVGAASTTLWRPTSTLGTQAVRSTTLRRRQATPLRSAALYGPYAPVGMQVRMLRGLDLMYRIEAPNGVFIVPNDAGLHNTVQQIIVGGHLVRVEKGRHIE